MFITSHIHNMSKQVLVKKSVQKVVITEAMSTAIENKFEYFNKYENLGNISMNLLKEGDKYILNLAVQYKDKLIRIKKGDSDFYHLLDVVKKSLKSTVSDLQSKSSKSSIRKIGVYSESEENMDELLEDVITQRSLIEPPVLTEEQALYEIQKSKRVFDVFKNEKGECCVIYCIKNDEYAVMTMV